MSTRQVLEFCKERGLTVALKDGVPVLKEASNNPKATEKLRAVLKIHRERIIEILSKEKS